MLDGRAMKVLVGKSLAPVDDVP
ncbi:hypothetical protein IFVP203_C1140030 [Vibrio parahaemolyticus]